MASTSNGTPSTASNTYLFVPIVLFFALLIVAVLRSPNLITSAGIGGAIIVATPLVLATYAVMAIAIAGRGTVDLSVGPLIGFINVTLVQLFGADLLSSPIGFFLYAVGVGIAYHLIMGLIIVFIRVQPIIVALSGYLALSGINLVIMARPGGTAPDWMAPWGQGTSIFSPVGVILVLSTAAWLLFSRTAFYGHLRLMGSDERAAYTSGVRINMVRLGAHAISGIYAGLAALTYTSLISSGDPTQGTTYTLIAVTALVLGGTSLAGGRGGVMGSLLGAANIYLITAVLATFNFGPVQSFVTDLSYGTVLVVSLLLTLVLPHIRSVVGNLSPLLFFVICSLISIGVMIHATYDYSAPAALARTGSAAPAVPPNAQAQGLDAIAGAEGANPSVATSAETTPPSAVANEQPAPVASVANTPVPPAAEPNPTTAALAPSAAPSAVATTEPPAAAVTAEAPTSAPATMSNEEVSATVPADGQAATQVAPAMEQALAPSGPSQVVQRAPPENFVFEDVEEGVRLEAHSTLALPLTYAAVLILSLLLVLRVTVAQADTRTLSPLVHVVMAAVVLLGIYVAANPANTARALGVAPLRASR